MPPRSLVIIFDDARTLWKHGIKRQNITSRRVCMTFRELSDPFLSGGEDEDLGKKLLDIAMSWHRSIDS